MATLKYEQKTRRKNRERRAKKEVSDAKLRLKALLAKNQDLKRDMRAAEARER